MVDSRENRVMQFLRDKYPAFVRAIHPRTCAVAFLAVLYIVGLLHWMSVFDFALFRVKDWSLVMKYSAVLRDALTHGKVPYVMTYGRHYTDRFLALPEVPLSPQYLLLAWLDDKPFNLLNILLLYSVSFAGLLCLRKEWRLSPVPFTFLYLLFSFNGYIVSRVAVGHTMWYGYFFLPYFHLLVLRITKGSFSERSCILLILVLSDASSRFVSSLHVVHSVLGLDGLVQSKTLAAHRICWHRFGPCQPVPVPSRSGDV
jgi:hypothetical protein